MGELIKTLVQLIKEIGKVLVNTIVWQVRKWIGK